MLVLQEPRGRILRRKRRGRDCSFCCLMSRWTCRPITKHSRSLVETPGCDAAPECYKHSGVFFCPTTPQRQRGTSCRARRRDALASGERESRTRRPKTVLPAGYKTAAPAKTRAALRLSGRQRGAFGEGIRVNHDSRERMRNRLGSPASPILQGGEMVLDQHQDYIARISRA